MDISKDAEGINLDKILTGKVYCALKDMTKLRKYDMCRRGVCPHANEKVCEEALENDIEKLQALLDESTDIKVQGLLSEKMELERAILAVQTNKALQLIKRSI